MRPMLTVLMPLLVCLATGCWPPGNVGPDAGGTAPCAHVPTYDTEPCCPEDVGARCFGTQAWACEPQWGLADGGAETYTWYLNGASPVSASCEPLP